MAEHDTDSGRQFQLRAWSRIEAKLLETFKATPSQEALKALVRWWDPDMEETDKRFEAALVLLAALRFGHEDHDYLATLTGVPLERVNRFAKRLEESRVWIPGGKTACTWMDFHNEEAVLFWDDGLPIATEQLWNTFHNFPYRRSVVMQSRLLQGHRKSLRDRPFRLIEPRRDFP